MSFFSRHKLRKLLEEIKKANQTIIGSDARRNIISGLKEKIDKEKKERSGKKEKENLTEKERKKINEDMNKLKAIEHLLAAVAAKNIPNYEKQRNISKKLSNTLKRAPYNSSTKKTIIQAKDWIEQAIRDIESIADEKESELIAKKVTGKIFEHETASKFSMPNPPGHTNKTSIKKKSLEKENINRYINEAEKELKSEKEIDKSAATIARFEEMKKNAAAKSQAATIARYEEMKKNEKKGGRRTRKVRRGKGKKGTRKH